MKVEGAGAGNGRGRRKRPISDINVTPLVDVMLVLLVIFMITAPLMQQGIEVELPKTQTSGLTPEDPLIVSIKKDGKIFLQRAEVPLPELEGKLTAILETRGDGQVLLRADTHVEYGTVAKTLAVMRKAGAKQIGMVTEPEA
jgi:biopolymer transport protein TolR